MRRAGLPTQLPSQLVCTAQHIVVANFKVGCVRNLIAMAAQKVTACGKEHGLLLIASGAPHSAGSAEVGETLAGVTLCNSEVNFLGDSFSISAILVLLVVELEEVLFRAVDSAREFISVPPPNPVDVLPRFEAAFALNTVHG